MRKNTIITYTKLICLKVITIGFFCLFLFSCKKGFLETIPNKALLIPQTTDDFEKLLDNIGVMNSSPALSIIAGDEFYTTPAGLAAYSSPQERNSYTWDVDVYQGRSISDWNYPYRQIFYANIVLEGLAKINDAAQKNVIEQLTGRAYFHRAYAYFQLSQMFCPVYQTSNSKTSLGLPLHLKADVNDQPYRSNLEDTYMQILGDLEKAEQLLPISVQFKNRPTIAAAIALKARTYLSMGKFEDAAAMAIKGLKISSKLIDYNTLVANLKSNANPFPAVLPNANDEVIYYANGIGYSFNSSTLMVDSLLFQSYDADDLRKPVYFYDRGNGVINIKGHYGGSSGSFFGLAIDELYLIIAECYARSNNANQAMDMLNNLLRTRWKTGTYKPLSASSAEQALILVLKERRKSLLRRGLRWMDLKRLNLKPETSTVVTRKLGDQIFTLLPNSNRYVFPIPDDEMAFGKLVQNPR